MAFYVFSTVCLKTIKSLTFNCSLGFMVLLLAFTRALRTIAAVGEVSIPGHGCPYSPQCGSSVLTSIQAKEARLKQLARYCHFKVLYLLVTCRGPGP